MNAFSCIIENLLSDTLDNDCGVPLDSLIPTQMLDEIMFDKDYKLEEFEYYGNYLISVYTSKWHEVRFKQHIEEKYLEVETMMF